MGDNILNLNLGTENIFKVIVHPLVPLQILEIYQRAQINKDSKSCGTLLGTVFPNRVEITNCYMVPLMEESANTVTFY